MRHVCIQYTIRPDVDLDELKCEIAEFVAGLHGHDAGHRYTSFQDKEEPRHFVHFGELVEDRMATFQEEPFFKRFSGYLRDRCVSGPEVSRLNPVASSR